MPFQRARETYGQGRNGGFVPRDRRVHELRGRVLQPGRAKGTRGQTQDLLGIGRPESLSGRQGQVPALRDPGRPEHFENGSCVDEVLRKFAERNHHRHSHALHVRLHGVHVFLSGKRPISIILC